MQKKFRWIQQGIVSVCIKKSESSVSYVFQNEFEIQIHFGCTLELVEEVIELPVHYYCLENFYSKIDDFISHPLKFRFYKGLLKWTQLFFETQIIYFVDDIVRFNLRLFFFGKTMLDVFMLTESVKTW